MSFSYLDNKNWRDVTRDERFFCAHLYEHILGNERDFIKWLNKRKLKDLKPKHAPVMKENLPKLLEDTNWEVGYEVCFYRDYNKNIRTIKGTRDYYSPKRTFDLCLFSENTIVIIEAKVHQLFKKKQIDDLKNDLKCLPDIVGKGVAIYSIALASSRYFDDYKTNGRVSLNCFSTRINWLEMHRLYNNDQTLLRAERVYKN